MAKGGGRERGRLDVCFCEAAAAAGAVCRCTRPYILYGTGQPLLINIKLISTSILHCHLFDGKIVSEKKRRAEC